MSFNFVSRTPLYARKQVGGAFVFTDEAKTTGNIWFVNSATGTDASGYGFNPDAPFATLNYAMTQATASQGDRIYLMPGHIETSTAAGGIALSTAGVAVFGLGTGRLRPTIKFSTSANASVAVTAANIYLGNVVVDCTGFAAVANPINVTATDFTVDSCEFIVNNATNQAVCAIQTSAAGSRLTVQNSYFRGTSDAGVTAALIIVGGDGHVIQNNRFIGGYSAGVGAIQNVTTACTNTIVWGNTINNLTASSTKAMVFVAASTGQISENLMQILSGTAPITGAAMSWVGANYYAATIATAGTLI